MEPDRPSTTDAAYTERLTRSVVPRQGWRRLVDPQRPYRWNIRRLGLGKVLDIGCGVGRNLDHLDGNGVGVDHNAASVQAARARGLVAYLPDEFAASADAGDGAFDSLLFAHVLEHLDADEAGPLVQQHLRYLRRGGRVVVICPQAKGQRSDATHVTMFTAERLKTLLSGLGLQIESARSFPFPTLVGRWFTHNETIVVASRPPGPAEHGPTEANQRPSSVAMARQTGT